MKIASKTVPPPSFNPIAVTITCECAEDMDTMKMVLQSARLGGGDRIRQIVDALLPHFTSI